MVDLARSIQELGLAGIIVLIALGVTVGLARQWWVPGWIYRQERQSRITAETQAVRNGESLAKSSEAYQELSDAFAVLSKSYADIKRVLTSERGARKRTGQADDPA